MLDLTAVQGFVAVADLLSFKKAAAALNCTTGAVSRRVDRAERDAGAVLLHRTSREVLLTRAGQEYLPHARALLDRAREAREAVAPGRVCGGSAPQPTLERAGYVI